MAAFKQSGTGIRSITVYAEKSTEEKESLLLALIAAINIIS
jgi:hypothetical protein